MKSKIYSFQNALVNECFEKVLSEGKCVLAAGCGAGKTNMAIDFIQRYLKKYPDRQVLVLTHGQSILKNQFHKRITEVEHRDDIWYNFSYLQLDNKNKNQNKIQQDVIIALPQSFQSKLPKIRKIGLVIVDEAHHYYSAKMVQIIISHYKIEHQLLLTGSPSSFISKNTSIVSISVGELLEKGVVHDPTIELVRSDYNYSFKDFNPTQMEIKSSVKFTKDQTFNTLDSIISLIHKKIHSRNNENILGKTLIACRNKKQARDVYEYFIKHNIKCVISLSGEDIGSSEIERFSNEPNISILVVVARGVLGFNLNSLSHVIDLTGSHNPDRIFQLMSRVIRKDPKISNKYFIKIASPHTVQSTYIIMNLVVALTFKPIYESYDGNPRKVTLKLPKDFIDSVTNRDKESQTNVYNNFNAIPNFDLFKKISNNEVYEGAYAYITIGEALNSLLKQPFWTKREDDLLKFHYGKLKMSEIANLLKRSKMAVNNRIVFFGLSKRKWDLQQISELKKFVADGKTTTQIAQIMNRTESAIYTQRKSLNISTSRKFNTEQMEIQNEIIRQYYNIITNKELQIKTKMGKDSLYRRLKTLKMSS